jgi:hypothetical protein
MQLDPHPNSFAAPHPGEVAEATRATKARNRMLEWTDMPDGERRAVIALGDRLGWIEICETKGQGSSNFRAVATVLLGALDSQDRRKIEEVVEEWLKRVGAQPLPRDGL